MKPFGVLLPFEKALSIIDSEIKEILAITSIDISNCLHRVLAQDIIASHTTPPFDRAAVDGYAIKARDTFGISRQNPRKLNIIGVVYAGEIPESRLASGECVQVATGAKIPYGSNAVIMIEDVSREDKQIKVIKPVHPEANIAPKGEDIKKGELILKKGTFLNPANIGVLASQGIFQISVYKKPEVAIIPTGKEIVELGQKLKPAQIYDINSHTISALVKENGCLASRLSIVGDTPYEIKTAIETSRDSDITVFTGGSSVGEKDLLYDVLEEMGKVYFHGIQIKPGKPTMFGKIGGKAVFGMPGYPTSCLINAYILLQPALRKMSRLPPKIHINVDAILGERIPGSTGRKQFLAVKLEENIAFPLFKESGAITGTAQADGYIVIAENIDIMEKDQPVTVTLF